MKTKIYFVRHGDVVNPNKIWYGRLPGFPLSKLGKKQMQDTSEKLKDKNIDIIYSSPLLRASQSAEIIKQKLNLKKIYFSKKILEVKSSLQGELDSTLKKINFNIFKSPGNLAKGETIDECLERMESFIKDVIKKHQGKNIVVVSHGDPIMLVRARYKGLPIVNESIRPGSKDYIKKGEYYLLTI